jgi:class 3 adenylate cyclase
MEDGQRSAACARLSCVRELEVRWARLDGKSIAYAVFGTGPFDLVLEQIWCPIDLLWELPALASFLDKLGRLARVIVYDPLGMGASDALADPTAATSETFADVLLAVLDAARAPRVVVFHTSASPTSLIFAATYPERVQALIIVNLRPSFHEVQQMSAEQRAQLAATLHGVRSLELQNPRVAHDPALRAWWARAHRLSNSPEQTLENVEYAARVDYESVLPAVRVPTLVLHRRENRMFDIATSRAAANRIPDARFVELPGSESDLFLGEQRPVFQALEEFLAIPETPVPDDRPLATVLFTDIVASTAQLAAQGDSAWRRVLEDHVQTAARIVEEYRGRLVRETGDGILATFDGPARAVRCATALLAAAQQRGITLRAGLHTGEIELRTADIAGIAVHVASRIADLAEPNEILVSRTVTDLTAGSGLQFDPRGDHQLKGVPGTWLTFAAHTST